MSIVIRNVDIVTLDAESTVLTGQDIIIEGRTIASVSDASPRRVADTVIDGTNHVALPGFFNAHCHAPMTFERGYAEDLPIDRWFNERIWVVESSLTSDDVYWGAALAACEMIRSGCVGFNDMYFYMDRVAEVVEQAGMKATLSWGMFGPEMEVGADLAGVLDFVDRWQERADGRIRTILAPHSPYICPPAFLREVSALARERNLPLHTHVAESAEQVEHSLRQYGRTPVEHLDDCDVFDVPCIAAHALYLGDGDIDILARHGVSVAHCPITYMKLAIGVNDLSRLISAGINVGIGTDGPGSNNDMDMKAAVRVTALLQKYQTRDAEALPGDMPLRMASAGGARAMGFPESGEIAPGRAADIILFDLDQPHLYPRHDLVANIVHAARGSDVSHVIVDSRLLLDNRELVTLDEERIMAEAERHAVAMVARPKHSMLQYQA